MGSYGFYSCTCPRCRYVIQYVCTQNRDEKDALLHATHNEWMISPCAHPGIDAAFLALLLKEGSLFMKLLPQKKKHGAAVPFTCSNHSSLWPFPFFTDCKSMQEYISWGGRYYATYQQGRVLCTDQDIIDWTYPYRRRYITQQTEVCWVSEMKGFGLFAKRDLPPNTFLGVYAGRIRRFQWFESGSHQYVAQMPQGVFSSLFSTSWVVDATEVGSEMRYINHRGGGRSSSGYKLGLWRHVPLLLLYTRRALRSGEEITIDYGASYWSSRT